MSADPVPELPRLERLPASLPADGSISIVLVEGSPVFRASSAVVRRIDRLLDKARSDELSPSEAEELTRYEEIDDYLSLLNRIVRNLQRA